MLFFYIKRVLIYYKVNITLFYNKVSYIKYYIYYILLINNNIHLLPMIYIDVVLSYKD